MTIYLAHNYAAGKFLEESVVIRLRQFGHVISSSWCNGSRNVDNTRLEDAERDLADIQKAEAFVMFVDQYGTIPGRGKWFELGYALAMGKKVFIVGQDCTPENCVFFALDSIVACDSIRDVLEILEDNKADVF